MKVVLKKCEVEGNSCGGCMYQSDMNCDPSKVKQDYNLPDTCGGGFIYVADYSDEKDTPVEIQKNYYIMTVNLSMFGMHHNDTATKKALLTVLTRDGLDSLVKNGSIQELTYDGLNFDIFKTKIKGHFENVEAYTPAGWRKLNFDDKTYEQGLNHISKVAGLQYYRIKPEPKNLLVLARDFCLNRNDTKMNSSICANCPMNKNHNCILVPYNNSSTEDIIQAEKVLREFEKGEIK